MTNTRTQIKTGAQKIAEIETELGATTDEEQLLCYKEEAEELRAAYEALQKENAAQAKRIEELEAATEHLGLTPNQAADGLVRYKAQVKRIAELHDIANDHRDSYIAASKALDSQKSEIESLRKQVEDVRDVLSCQNALDKFEIIDRITSALKNGE